MNHPHLRELLRSIKERIRYPNKSGVVAELSAAIAEADGFLATEDSCECDPAWAYRTASGRNPSCPAHGNEVSR